MACVYEITELSNNMKYLGSHHGDSSAVGTTYFTSSTNKDFQNRYKKSCKEGLNKFLTICWEFDKWEESQKEEHKKLQAVTNRDNYYNLMFCVPVIREIDENCLLRKEFDNNVSMRSAFEGYSKRHNIDKHDVDAIRKWKPSYVPVSESFLQKYFDGDTRMCDAFRVFSKKHNIEHTLENIEIFKNNFNPKTRKEASIIWFSNKEDEPKMKRAFLEYSKRCDVEDSVENYEKWRPQYKPYSESLIRKYFNGNKRARDAFVNHARRKNLEHTPENINKFKKSYKPRSFT